MRFIFWEQIYGQLKKGRITMKKIISILLALSMLFSLNTVAFAAESGTTDELQIVEENGTRTVSLNDGVGLSNMLDSIATKEIVGRAIQ